MKKTICGMWWICLILLIIEVKIEEALQSSGEETSNFVIDSSTFEDEEDYYLDPQLATSQNDTENDGKHKKPFYKWRRT